MMAQKRALSSQVDSIAQSLRSTATEVTTIEAAALRLAAAGNERAALGEEISAASEAIAASVEETGAMTAKAFKAQQGLTELAQSLLSGVEESSSAPLDLIEHQVFEQVSEAGLTLVLVT